MSWLPSFGSLASAWFFLLLIPLVLFYFLKLRRPKLRVPSIVLWRQVLDDQRVNSPFQRFKRHLLLLLQILLLLLLVTAAMQPFIQGRQERVTRLPILIDCSASMGALAESGGVSRLELAKQKVRERIDGLLPDQKLCLIAFGQRARKITGFTNNKRLLHKALDEITVRDVESELEHALRLTQALARQAVFDEVLLLSDGNLPERANFELSFTLSYERMTPPGDNLGITAANAKRSRDGSWHVFVEVSATGEATSGGEVILTELGREELGKERVTLTDDRTSRLVFELEGDQPQFLQIELRPDGFDALASDNAAYLDLPATRPLLVYVPQAMEAVALALHSVPGVTMSARTEDVYDLAITDRKDDLTISARTRLTIGLIPEDVAPLVTVKRDGAGEVIDWDRRAPVLQHVLFGDVVLLDELVNKPKVGDAEFENKGYEVLLYGRKAPLLLRKRVDGRLDFHLLFHTDRSTFPYRIGFPIMMANLVQQARLVAGLGEVAGLNTGLLPPRRLTPKTAYEIAGPDGMDVQTAVSGDDGQLRGIPASKVGIYRISDGGTIAAVVGVGLLSPSESSLVSVEEIQFNEALSVSASEAEVPTDRALWPLLAWLALIVLLVEWWFFNNRRIR